MNEPTQQEVNAMVNEFKYEILKLCSDKSIGIGFATIPEVSNNIAQYEVVIKPLLRENGYDVPSVSEIFGVDISVTEH